MNATLEFNLPEEQEEFDHASKGFSYWIAICDFDEVLRSRLKYETNPNWDAATVSEIREKLWEIMNE